MNYKETDKLRASYLLTCKNVKFEGTEVVDGLLYFLFSPVKVAENQITLMLMKQSELIQPGVLLDALENVNQVIWNFRKKGKTLVGGE